jgi:hypothetical protein
MADTPILRFRRRARDGSTHPLLSPGQAESISEGLLAGEREARAKKAVRVHPLHDAQCLARIAPARRAAIVTAARHNVNNRWTTALVLAVPMALYGAAMWIWADAVPDLAGMALPIFLFGPAIAVHARLVRREIGLLVERDSPGGSGPL